MEIGLKHVVFFLILATIGTFILYLAFGTGPIGKACEPGYTNAGGVCLSLREECESRSGSYYFDESRQRCFATD
jgi:hypothetical protein